MERQQNGVLFLLTITTAVFMPMQAWSGYFGMNFQVRSDADGWIQADPLLQLGGSGLLVYWAVVLVFTGILIWVVARQARWI